MNRVMLIGRLTRDPELRYSGEIPVARFSIAINRGKDRKGQDKGADFPSIVCFGKTAELVDKYLAKGRQVAIEGAIRTGSYTKQDGTKVYTTDVAADRVEFLGSRDGAQTSGQPSRRELDNNPLMSGQTIMPAADQSGAPTGFEAIEDDDIPF